VFISDVAHTVSSQPLAVLLLCLLREGSREGKRKGGEELVVSLGGRGSTCDRRLPASALAGPSDAERCLGKGARKERGREERCRRA